MTGNIESDYAKLPFDFPRPISLGAVPGGQPKFLVTSYQGKFYPLGCTPPELYERWQICEEIVQELTIRSRESKAGKHSHMSEVTILEQYLTSLIKTDRASEAEARWIIRQVARTLEWPVP